MTKQILRLETVSLYTQITNSALLEDVSFTINQGEFLGIIGASGAGKTTLLRLLNRLINPSLGNIYFTEQNIKNIPIISLRQQIVLVPQESKLLGMTVQETLTYPLKLLKLTPTEIKTRLATWIDKLNIPEDWLNRTELQLSLGQRQLVAIARALVMQPQILLLDEPTSALDVGKANFLLQILTELTNTNNMTIIMVNHQLELIEKFTHRVIYLDKGHLLEDKLMKDTNWENIKNQLFKSQIKEEFDEF